MGDILALRLQLTYHIIYLMLSKCMNLGKLTQTYGFLNHATIKEMATFPHGLSLTVLAKINSFRAFVFQQRTNPENRQ